MLNSNPEKIAAWQQRSRQPLKRTPLAATTTPQRKTKIRAQSAKRKKQNQEYLRRRLEFFCQFPFCMRCSSLGKLQTATDIHHAAGRNGERLNAEEDWRGVCRVCHDWCHAHPQEAKAAGWSISRLSPVTDDDFMGGDAKCGNPPSAS